MSGSTVAIVVLERTFATPGDGISLLMIVRLSFVADGIILPVCDYLEFNAIIFGLYSVLPRGERLDSVFTLA